MTAIAEEVPPGEWMESVAQVLPIAYRAAMPYTLGESVAELGLWARSARTESWSNRGNRDSLDADLASGLEAVGPRLSALVSDLLPRLNTNVDREDIADAAEEFTSRWTRPEAIVAAFRDLCDAAANGSEGIWELKPRGEILASQLGEMSRGWGLLDRASTMLVGEPDEHDVQSWVGPGATSDDLTPALRLEATERLLATESATGHIVVWLLYRRAVISWRLSVGPITFLRADWAIPNAIRDDGQEFEERAELREMIENTFWLREDELLEGEGADERYVLARVDLGERKAAGAAADAARRVDALLSIAVEAGGVSWINTETSTTQINGQSLGSTLGRGQRRRRGQFDDDYGIHATSDLLHHWAGLLDESLALGPMPDFLVEALSAVREAGMIDHRDVSFYDSRPVTPRVATALEDHAVELIASLAELTPERLVTTLQEYEADYVSEQLVLTALISPIDINRQNGGGEEQIEALEHIVARYESGGTRVVSVDKVWAVRDQLRDLSVSPASRITFEAALSAISSPVAEQAVDERAERRVALLRARHRRVRNAITHGNPVTPAALNSVRDFSERVARTAIGVALHAFARRLTIPTVLALDTDARAARRREMRGGASQVDRVIAAASSELGDAAQPSIATE